MSNDISNHPRYQELLELQDLIEQKRNIVENQRDDIRKANELTKGTDEVPATLTDVCTALDKTIPDWIRGEGEGAFSEEYYETPSERLLPHAIYKGAKEIINSIFGDISDDVGVTLRGRGGNLMPQISPLTGKEKTYHENLDDLNNLVAKSDSLSSNMFLETIKGPDTVPDIVSDPEELKNPTEPYSEDFGMQGLINQYRLQLGNQYSDAAIEQYIKLVNPAQYDAARNSGYQEVYEDRKDLKPSFTDVWSNTRATSSTVELANLKYGVPAIAILQKDKWLTGTPEEDDKRWLTMVEHLPEFKGLTDDQKIAFKQRLLTNPNTQAVNAYAFSLLNEADKEIKNTFRNNPEAAGITQYLEESGLFFDDDGRLVFHLQAVESVGQALNSIIMGRLSGGIVSKFKNFAVDALIGEHGLLTGQIGRKIPFAKPLVEGLEKSAPVWKAKLEFPARAAGQMLYGYSMEGSSYAVESYGDLVNEQVISPERYQRIVQETKDQYSNIKDADGSSPTDTQVLMMTDLWVKENYENRDGVIIQKPITNLDHIAEALAIGTTIYATGASFVEVLDVWASKFGLGGVGKTMYKRNTVDFVNRYLRRLPFASNWRDLRKVFH